MHLNYSFVVTEQQAGQRIDKVLSEHPEVQTRNRALHLIEHQFVLVGQKIPKPSYICRLNDIIQFEIKKIESQEIQKYDFPLDIVFEDNDLIVVNKPSGLVVHPAAGHSTDTLVNALMNHTSQLSMKFGEQRPGIVHRIDKETSGLLVIAKNDNSHSKLSEQFKNKTTHRLYEAVVIGNILTTSGTISSYLLRHPVDRKRYASVRDFQKKIIQEKIQDNPEGKWAVTHFQKIRNQKGLTLLQLKLETGRTHQIRVHLSEKGFPIVGDNLYGADKKLKSLEGTVLKAQIKNLNRFYLHAAELGFIHPTSGEWMQFKVPWPDLDLKNIQSWGLVK